MIISIAFEDYVSARSAILLASRGKIEEAAAIYEKGNCPLPPLDVVVLWQATEERMIKGKEVVIVRKIKLDLTTGKAETTCQKVRRKTNYKLN